MSVDTILVVDDELSVRHVIAAILEEEGFGVLQAANGAECMRLFYEKRPDVVLLDVLMPVKDGRETCKQLREISNVPIIMLTAVTDEREKVERLMEGADDYVSKPFNNRELVARIRANLRRLRNYTTPVQNNYDDGVLYIDFDTHQIKMNKQSVRITPMEWRLLECLIKHKNKVVTSDTLLHQIWGSDYQNANNLKVTMSNLRGKLSEPARHPRYLQTVRNSGYRFQGHD